MTVNVLLWITQGLVAAAFLAAGLMKLVTPGKELADRVPFLPAPFQRGMGVVDLVGAVGLIVPAATGIAPILTPVAAVGAAIVMAGAIPVHVRLNDRFGTSAVVVLLVLSIVIAWGRFGAYAS